MRHFLLILISFCVLGIKGQNNTLNINYVVHPPFAIKDSAGPKGIEVDIINEYLLWLKATKKMDFTVSYNAFTDYASLLAETKKSSVKSIGLGSCITNSEKPGEVEYTCSYLKNLSFCITNGNAPDIKTKNQTDIYRVLSSMTALTINNSNLNNCTNEIKKLYVKDLKITYVNTQVEILNTIAKNILNFGYVDAIEFWLYLKNNPNKFLKVQKSLDQTKETFSLLLPKGSEHKALFNEFFTSFKTGTKYRLILEKYLGGFMTQNMAMK